MELSYLPTLDREEANERLAPLLVPGALDSPPLGRRIDRLADSFQRYASSYPLPLWAPGVVVTNEMRGWTEALFPLSEVRRVFELVLTAGCRIRPALSGSYLHSSATWLDLLQRLRPQIAKADPSVTLRQIAEDGLKRRDLLFSLLLPHHFGGAFDRYPLQGEWIRRWLEQNRSRLEGRVRILDSACGSGEGTYAAAELVSATGFQATGSAVEGSTVEPFELFAAAHAFFPHDPEREKLYRGRVAPLLTDEGVPIAFYLDDVGSEPGRKPYDLVLCNGLIGGPLMHEREHLAKAVRALALRVTPGGVLLAADKFHAGWRQKVPAESLLALMRENGLTPLEIAEGIAARKG